MSFALDEPVRELARCAQDPKIHTALEFFAKPVYK